MKTFPRDFQVVEGVWHPFVEDPVPYSDGDEAERYLEETFANTSDLSSDSPALAVAIKDWPSQYHLSPQRANLLRPLGIPRSARVLELGCGCGAVTRFLGENAGHVVAVEGSPVRARLARLRCGDLANVDVVAGNFDDIRMTAPFDIVTLIGVLEYAGIFWRRAGEPFEGMLRFACENLSPNGVLIIAIENKLGMKYFSGCTEDHLARSFPGIEGYPDNDGPRTFGRAELIGIASRCGFSDFEMLLPFPDYKIPSTLINGRFTSAEDCRKYNLVDWCRDPFRDYGKEREHLFNDQLALASVAKSGLMADFSNSFLLIAAREPFGEDSVIRRSTWIAKRFNMLRRPEYRTVTTLLEKDGAPVIAKERVNGLRPASSPPVRLSVAPERPFIVGGKSLSLEMLRAIRRNAGGEKEFLGFVAGWIDYLRSRRIPGTDLLPPSHVDCQPGNLILDPAGALHYIDDEWHWREPVSMDWVLFRGLFVFWLECGRWIERSILPKDARFADFLSLSLGPSGIAIGRKRVEELIALETALHEAVSPFPPISYGELLHGIGDDAESHADPRPPGGDAGLVAMVEEHFQSGDVVRALSLAGDIAEKYPNNAANWNNIGVILNHLGRQQQAKECLRIALALDDRFAEARKNMEAIDGDGSRTAADAGPVERESPLPESRNPVRTGGGEDLRIVAIMAVYNEGDVIRHSIGDLVEQGIEVYLIDNCSTDNTVEEASRWKGKGLIHIERFPDDAKYPLELRREYAWKQILLRKEELASTLGADWYIHHDGDEFRESPWPGLTLKEAIRVVDAMGYNAIQFAVYNFKPTDNGFTPGSDVRKALTHYLPLPEHASHMQVKAWRYTGGRPMIVENGGHNIRFDGRRIFPTRFLLRHYPVRSQQHGVKKVFDDRKGRFSKAEKEHGWHRQYDHIVNTDHNFLCDPGELHLYDGNVARLQILSYQAFSMSENALGEETVRRIIRDNWFDKRALDIERNVLNIW